MAEINVRNVGLEYQGDHNRTFTALQNVSFDVRDGEFVSIIGPSGCGKSTLLNLFVGLSRPSAGEILLNGQKLVGPGKERSVVFQQYALFPWMTALKNIVFALKQVKTDLAKKDLERIARDFLGQVGLRDFADKFPNELSGGMQQRVAIARALAAGADTLLMDEPFGAIDPKTRSELQELLLHLWQASGQRKTVIFITHDIDEAIFLADRIVVLSSSPGRVKTIITVPFERPRSRSAIMVDPAYNRLRNQIVQLFYNEISRQIGGAEVVL